ncbi:MAG: ATP-binding protein [Halobacteriota archaeon]
MPRNFLLFGLMQRMCLVEKVGTGIMRMNHAMEEYKLKKTLIEADENWFTIIFNRRSEKWSETIQKAVEKAVEKILGLIKENLGIIAKRHCCDR